MGSTPETEPVPGLERRVLEVAATLFFLLMLLSPLYGFHRDELYFLDAGRHLQSGYVDQPVLVPLLARVSLSLFGVSPPGLRLWPALAAFATVVVAALNARELGGARRAQLLAAIGAATMPALLAIDHVLGSTAIDVLVWATLGWLVLRVDRTRDTRLWLVAGAVVAIGVANKHSVVFFALALMVGGLVTGGRPLIENARARSPAPSLSTTLERDFLSAGGANGAPERIGEVPKPVLVVRKRTMTIRTSGEHDHHLQHCH